jgi:5-methylcytosine-specific restriction endonuclease McrA
MSHALPGGDLGALFERAIDALLERETKRRLGAGKPRKRRPLAEGSRHVPVDVARLVRDRDGGQCTFVDEQGRRCTERRHLTIEHRHPYALGGPPTVDNLCLLCAAHNAHNARKVFGEAHIEAKQAEARNRARSDRSKGDPYAKVHGALRTMGFREPEVRRTLAELRQSQVGPELEPLLRAALELLAPPAPTYAPTPRREQPDDAAARTGA